MFCALCFVFFGDSFGFVEFATPELAQQATLISADMDGRTPEFRITTEQPARAPREFTSERSDRPPRIDRSSGPRNPPTNTIWVGNVAWAVEEGELQDIFEQYGNIKRVSMPKDNETGRSRGIAYIEFDSEAAAAKAIESSLVDGGGIELEQRVLRLDFAEVKSRDTFGGDRGGRGGFGGGRGGGRGGFGGGRDGGKLCSDLREFIARRC